MLAGLAVRCRQELRAVDLLGRCGGEEFVVLLPESDLATARQAAERLRRCAEQTAIDTDAGPVTITVSLGAADLDEICTDLEGSLERGRSGPLRRQTGGRNCVVVDGSQLS